MASVYAVKKSLGISEVLAILQNPPANPVTNPPKKPKADHVYVFRAETVDKQGMPKVKFDYHVTNLCILAYVCMHKTD